jgi:hypothetical protein
MSSRPIFIPNDVRSAYEYIIEEFRKVAETATHNNMQIDKPLKDCFHESEDGKSINYIECFHLQDWPCKKLSKGKRLDIFVKAMETFSRKPFLLTKSTVYVNYFIISSRNASLRQALHYDFVDGGQINHPFFHAQLIDDHISKEDLYCVGLEQGLRIALQSTKCWVTTKIPTPDMTLTSVFYCLVADHLGEDIFREFANKVESAQNRLPHPQYAALKDSLQENKSHIKSSHWFAHRKILWQ